MNAIQQNPRDVTVLISGRRSVRAFLDRPVRRRVIEDLLAVASRAPSGNNSQPWRIHVLTGSAKTRLSDAILTERASGAPEPVAEYEYYPRVWPEPYLGRRREIGWNLYHLLGIEKEDRPSARRWHDQNFVFFGAPVGLIFTQDRRLGLGSFIDLGMFLEAFAIAARTSELETCAQAAFAAYHATIRRQLGLAPEEMVICGLALGFEDKAAVPNRLRTTRVPVADFTTFHAE